VVAHRALLHRAGAAPVELAVKPAPAESSDDGGRSSASASSGGGASVEEPRCPDLNLDLSVGPPAAADTPTSQSQLAVCLCYRLGLRAGEACGCQAQADNAGQQRFRFSEFRTERRVVK
jgi:transcription factor MYB, plant